MQQIPTMIYAYGYWQPGEGQVPLWPAGITGAAPLETFTMPCQIEKPLRLLYAQVPEELFCGPAAEQRLENAAWVAAGALAHHEVILAAHASGTVLPIRWGTVFRDLLSAQEPFLAQAQRWPDLFQRAAGAEECEVQLVCQHELLRQRWLESHRAGWSRLPAGRRYLAERAAEGQAEAYVEQESLAVWSRLEAGLADLESAGQLRAKAIRRAGSRVYLVERSCQEFADLVEMRNELEDGFHFEFAGIWPPYSFSSPELRTPEPEESTLAAEPTLCSRGSD